MNPLKYHYVCDDLAVIIQTQNAKIKKPKNKLTMFMMMLHGKAYWEDEAFLQHIIPMILHTIASALIYFVFGHNNISLLASVLFFIHPCHTEMSIWLSAKGYTLTTIWVLLAFHFPILAFFIFVVPTMICISGIFAPLIFLLQPNILNVIALFSIYTVWKHSQWAFNKEKNMKLKGFEGNDVALKISPYKFIIALKFYGYYFVNCIFGISYTFYHSYMEEFLDTQKGIKEGRKIDRYFFIGLFFAGLLIYSLITNPFSIFTLGLFWSTVTVAMWCNLVSTGQQYIANRYYYLPNIGLMIAISSVIINYPILTGALIGWYLARLIPSIKQFKNVYWHFFYQIYNQPDLYYSWINMGCLNFARGNFKAAVGDFSQALILRPNNFKAMFDLSSCFIALYKIPEAIKAFEDARKCDIYGQEEKANQPIKDRMALLNKIIESKGKIKLKIEDIPTIT